MPTVTAQPVTGAPVQLTVDISLQRAAERALRYGIRLAHADGHWLANGGAVVAMNPSNGEILAMASNPTFKPGSSSAAPIRRSWRRSSTRRWRRRRTIRA